MQVDSVDGREAAEGRPYRVLVVHDQPAVVWALSNFLKLAGYEALQARSGDLALAAMDQAPPDFVIAGWEGPELSGVELCRRIRARDLRDYVFVFLLTPDLKSSDLVDALQAGADDFLAMPLVHGELLSRLRTGARMLEYERRLAQRASVDRLTGLGSRQSFMDRLARLLPSPARRGSPVSCVLADIDYFDRVNQLLGRAAGDLALKTVSGCLVAACKEPDCVYRVGDNRFGVLLAGAAEPEAAGWAERCRSSLAALQAPVGSPSTRLTASFGVAQIGQGVSVEAAISLAEGRLLVAKQSGRDRVVAGSGMSAVTIAGGEGAGSSDPLRSAVARDVMTSSVLALHPWETLVSAAELMRDARLTVLPVVDVDGKLLGTLSQAAIHDVATGQTAPSGTVAEALAADVPYFEEETTVQGLFEFFRREEANRVEVVFGGRPTGFVTRGSLAALGQPLSTETFTQTASGHRSADLLVADLAMVEEA